MYGLKIVVFIYFLRICGANNPVALYGHYRSLVIGSARSHGVTRSEEHRCCTQILSSKNKVNGSFSLLETWRVTCLESFGSSAALHSQSGSVYLQRHGHIPHPLSEDPGPVLSDLPQPCRLRYVRLTFIHVMVAAFWGQSEAFIMFLTLSHWSGIRRVRRLEPCSVWGSPRGNVCVGGEEGPVWQQWLISLCSQVHGV